MTIEAAGYKGNQTVPDRVKGKLGDAIVAKIPTAFEICVARETKFAPGSVEEYLRRIANGEQAVFVPNHLSVWDGGVVAANVIAPLKVLTPDLKVAMLITGSLSANMQGSFMDSVWPFMQEPMRQHGVDELWPVRRLKDIKKGVPPTDEQEQSLRNLTYAAKNNIAVVTFFEGTVDGGRKQHVWSSSVRGMQDTKQQTLGRMVNWADIAKKNVFFVPIALTGTEHIYSPNSNLPTPEALVALYSKKNLGIVQVQVGMPIDGKEAQAEAKHQYAEKNKYIIFSSDISSEEKKYEKMQVDKGVGVIVAKAIAEMLPPRYKGAFADSHDIAA